jgi:hypothetical protein
MILDGWLNVIYFFVFAAIALLWRPTSNNERYGLQQLTDIDPDFDEQGMRRESIKLGKVVQDDMEYDEETAEDIFQWVEDSTFC